MSNSPDVPTVTNPNTTAANQQALNTQAGIDSQAGSMVNQVGPQGSLTYSQTGTSPDGTPLYTATTKLSDANQQLLNVLQGTQATAGQQGQALISGANYGASSPSDVIGDSTSGLTQAAMQKQVAYLNPFFTQQTDQLDTKLKNQGFAPGQPGYDNAMNALKQSQGQTVTGFESTMEPQMYAQAYQNYMTPATLGGTLAGLGAPTNPTFQTTPSLTVQPANLIGATANADSANMAAYTAQNNQNNAMMSGLFGIPTSVLGGWAGSGGVSSLLGAASLAAV